MSRARDDRSRQRDPRLRRRARLRARHARSSRASSTARPAGHRRRPRHGRRRPGASRRPRHEGRQPHPGRGAPRLRGGGSGSGVASYIVLGVLALVVAMSAAYTLTNRSLGDRPRASSTSVAVAGRRPRRRQAQRYSSYTDFTALRQKRTETVRSLAASRFDWSHALHEVARTIPSNAWLTSLKRHRHARRQRSKAAASDPLRASPAEPGARADRAARRARPTSRRSSRSLRRIDGVERVSLSSSQKLDQSAASASGGGTRRRLPQRQRPLPAVLDDPLLRHPPTRRERRPDRVGDHDPMTDCATALVIVGVLLIGRRSPASGSSRSRPSASEAARPAGADRHADRSG